MPKISLIADPGQNVARGLKWIISSFIMTGIRTPGYFFFYDFSKFVKIAFTILEIIYIDRQVVPP